MKTEINGKPIKRREGAPHVVRTGWTETYGGRDVCVSMRVYFGLHYIRGNRAPYFSVTADGKENGRESFGGACHDIIAERLPDLADVIALHLSDIDGAPMYAEENGWHWLAKAAGIPQRWEPDQNQGECRRIFAKHCRITEAEADAIIAAVTKPEPVPWAVDPHAVRRDAWREICAGMRPRWKAEADAVIDRYGLSVYGGAWEAA